MGYRHPNDAAHEPRKAKAEGIMLSGEDFIIRRAASIRVSDAREVICHVAPGTYAGLIDQARRMRMTPSTLAAEFITERVTNARLPPPVVKHPDQFADLRKPDDLVKQLEAAHEKIAALKDRLTYQENARALRFAQKEAAEKRIAVLEQELREEQALRVGAIERLNVAESERDEARAVAEGLQNELYQQRDALEALRERLKTRQPVTTPAYDPDAYLVTSPPAIVTIQAEQPLEPATRKALAVMADAAASHLRSIRALRAAGNSAADIARALGLPLDQVKQTFKGVK